MTAFLTLEGAGDKNLSFFRETNHLFGEVFAEWDLAERQVYQENPPSDDYLKKLLVNPNFIVVVALEKDVVIGALTGYILDKYEQERREIHLYDLAVHPDYRRQKVATGLIKHLNVEAKKRGVYLIFVQADYGDEPPIKLYESLGKKERIFHFDLNKIDSID